MLGAEDRYAKVSITVLEELSFPGHRGMGRYTVAQEYSALECGRSLGVIYQWRKQVTTGDLTQSCNMGLCARTSRSVPGRGMVRGVCVCVRGKGKGDSDADGRTLPDRVV